MPDAEKSKDENKDLPAEDVRWDALGDEPESGPPPVDGQADDAKDDAQPESGETKDVPPDLVPAPEPEVPEDTETDETPFDDEKTDEAIDEIVAKEGDELLAVQDAAAAKSGVKVAQKSHFWRHKWIRWVIFIILFGGLAAVAAVPKTRYLALNTAGVRSSTSVSVVDSTTQLPLKGVTFSIGGKEAKTDSDGEAKLTGLKLGPTQLVISQVGFEEVKRSVTLGWGSNPFGVVALKATGVQYVIEVRDYLSEKPIEGVEATGGEGSAISGKDGKITLTLESAVVPAEGVVLSKAGYRSENITLDADPKKPTKASLVLARKAVFVTKQSGKYDVYKSDLDGKNREVLLAGSGNENSNISLVTSPDGARAAYVSTRDNKRDSGGFLLSTLTLITIENGNTLTIAESPQIQLIDWVGSRLIFQTGSTDSSADDRYAVVSYDYANNTRLQLAAANKLTAVLSAKGLVYYAIGANEADPSMQLGLFKIGADGKGGQRVFDSELSTVLRTSYTALNLQSADGTWYTYDLASGSKSQISTPTSLANRLYIDNEGRTKSLWAGQSKLMAYDIVAGKDVDVATQSGLTYPVQWAGGATVVYRVSSGSEIADYAVSLDGGTPHKVADVTPTYGFSQAQ